MPRRPSLSERLEGQDRGRDAFLPDPRRSDGDAVGAVGQADGGPSTEDRPPSTADGPPSTVTGERSTVHPQPSTVDGQPKTVDGRGSVDGAAVGSWEDQHKRVTFYCPTQLLALIEEEMQRSGRSKTSVIVDALRDDLTES